MWLKASPKEYELFLDAARPFWRVNARPPSGDGFIVVEAFHQDFRVLLRNLTVANAIRRSEDAHLVVITGTNQMWSRALWTEFRVDRVEEVARAYGASEVIDLHKLAQQEAGAPGSVRLRLSFADAPCPTRPALDEATLRANAVATFCRLAFVPEMTPDLAADPRLARCEATGAALSRLYESLFAAGPIALVTSHVDYDQWGLAVESARRAGVPVVHTQQTGSMKAYALFPETASGEPTLRAELTRQVGTFFGEHVWPIRERLRPAAELIAWRAKANLGRPSWWRGGMAASVDLTNPVERGQVRQHGLTRLGFDPQRPVVTVFNHAVSDALGTNLEVFDSLFEWFGQTAEFARRTPEASWLLLDHPAQLRYDHSGSFASVAKRFDGVAHMAFRPSTAISKNMLWSLTDLGVTVRGSVSNELPAYGIPVIQAGWSEWSACGMSWVTEDAGCYWKALERAIRSLAAGEQVITPEQVERARLWLWFYRAGTDVVSPLVPHWEIWPADRLLHSLRVAMRCVETDGDPLFAAVDRMWRDRAPLLTRYDLTAAHSDALVPQIRRVADGTGRGRALAEAETPGTGRRISSPRR